MTGQCPAADQRWDERHCVAWPSVPQTDVEVGGSASPACRDTFGHDADAAAVVAESRGGDRADECHRPGLLQGKSFNASEQSRFGIELGEHERSPKQHSASG